MIIGRYLINSLVIEIHDVDITIHWDNSAIPWRGIDSNTNDIFALLPHNAPFNSETKQMKRILYDKYRKPDLEAITESSTHIDTQEINNIHTLLKKYESLFVGSLGTWNVKHYDIIL